MSAFDYIDDYFLNDDEYELHFNSTEPEPKLISFKRLKKINPEAHAALLRCKKAANERKKIFMVKRKPTLVKVGKHLIDPNDVVAISQVKSHLFIVKLRSNPNPAFPIWVEEKEIGPLLDFFNIVEE